MNNYNGQKRVIESITPVEHTIDNEEVKMKTILPNDNLNKNKNNKRGKILLVILIFALIGIAIECFYFKDVFFCDQDESNRTITSNQNPNKPASDELEVGSLGNKKREAGLICDDISCTSNIKAKVYINDNGKIVYEYQEKNIVNVDNTINDKVINIAVGYSCDGADKRLVALTEKGEVYYNTNNLLNFETGDYALNFVKVKSDKKVLGLEEKVPPTPTTCSNNQIFAYIDKDTMLQVTANNTESGVQYVLGSSYEELYPYKDFIGNVVNGPIYYLFNDNTVTYNNITNFIMINNNKLQVSKLIINNITNTRDNYNLTRYDYLVSNDNKLYELSYMPVSASESNYQIRLYNEATITSISEDNKTVTITFDNGVTFVTTGEYSLKEL